MSKNNINSFAENMRLTVAQQVNLLSMLTAMQRSMTTNDSYVTFEYLDTLGRDSIYQLPSYTSVVNRLKSMEDTINTIASGHGLVTLTDGTRREVKVLAIAKTPDQIYGLQDPSTFKLDTNWFFEDLMFPGVTVEIDLTGKIEDTADRVKVLRIILDARNDKCRRIWYSTLSTTNYDYVSLKSLLAANDVTYAEDEEIINLPLVRNTKAGLFLVIDDPLIYNRNVWYTLDTLMYSTVSVDGVSQGKNNILSLNDYLSYDDSIFQVIEINQNESKVRLRRITGAGLPGIYASFSYYQDPFRSKTIDVRFGAHEYNIIYVKGIAEAYNLEADSWSSPAKFSADELLYKNNYGNITGIPLSQYYSLYIVDWGAKMLDEAKEKAVTAWSGHTPYAPILNADDLRVVQINTQINAAVDKVTVRNHAALIADDKTKIDSLRNTIADLKSELQRITNISEYNSKQELIKTQTLELLNAQASYSSNVAAFQSEIRTNGALLVTPKYHIRGFFSIPEYQKRTDNAGYEEIIGFDIAYRYVKEDNTPVLLNTFTYNDTSNEGSKITGTFTDWNIILSQLKVKVADENGYVWRTENVADGTEININQIDIPILKGERVEIKVRSISEAGYPMNPLKSVWSNSVIVSFPRNLSTTNEIAELIKDVNDDALNISITNMLDSIGVSTHLDDTIPNINSVNGLYFKHLAKNVAYENVDLNTGTLVITSVSVLDKIDLIEGEFNSVGYLGDLSNINYINYDISVDEDE